MEALEGRRGDTAWVTGETRRVGCNMINMETSSIYFSVVLEIHQSVFYKSYFRLDPHVDYAFMLNCIYFRLLSNIFS